MKVRGLRVGRLREWWAVVRWNVRNGDLRWRDLPRMVWGGLTALMGQGQAAGVGMGRYRACARCPMSAVIWHPPRPMHRVCGLCGCYCAYKVSASEEGACPGGRW